MVLYPAPPTLFEYLPLLSWGNGGLGAQFTPIKGHSKANPLHAWVLFSRDGGARERLPTNQINASSFGITLCAGEN